MEHPFFHHEHWQVESFSLCNRKITVKQIPDYRIIYERRFGSYENLSRDWKEMLARYQAYITGETLFFERTYDDPAVTRNKNCLYDIGISVGEACALENTTVLKGGKCAVYHFKGHAKTIYASYQTIFLVWLPQTHYVLDESRSLFDLYTMVDEESMEMEFDICIPLQ